MNKNLAYEISFAVLALVAVAIAFADILDKIPQDYYALLMIVDKAILFIFAADYFYGLYRSKNKREFFKSNIFDLLAIIPFDSFFRAFRLVRLARVIKMAVFAHRFTSRATPFLKTNGFIYILFLTIFLMAVGSIIAFYFEKGASMESYSDAVWWSFVTTTTVGYREVAPETMGGRVTAAFLMLAGIGFIGMLTGTITTYFLKKTKPTPKRDDQILDLTDVDIETFEKIREYSEYMKSKVKEEA